MIGRRINRVWKEIRVFEEAMLELRAAMNNSTSKNQIMEFDRDRLEKKYNQGLRHGGNNIHNRRFSNVYERLLRNRKHLPEDLLKAFQAGLQDGYHNHGKSHFDEWFKHEFLPSKKK